MSISAVNPNKVLGLRPGQDSGSKFSGIAAPASVCISGYDAVYIMPWQTRVTQIPGI